MIKSDNDNDNKNDNDNHNDEVLSELIIEEATMN